MALTGSCCMLCVYGLGQEVRAAINYVFIGQGVGGRGAAMTNTPLCKVYR